MQYLFRIKRKINYFVDSFFFFLKRKKLVTEIERNTIKTIYLFSSPTHSNLGDQAQLFCWHLFFSEQYPSYRIIEIPCLIGDKQILKIIKANLKSDDLLFVHSGYLLYDPHPELPFICDVVELFKTKRITILPQTINIRDKRNIDRLCGFNSHPDLHIICRDKVSLHYASELFPECKLSLMPDIVTSLIGNSVYSKCNTKRDGILFCLRNDGEKFYSNRELVTLKSSFGRIKADVFDTTINKSKRSWLNKREDYIKKVIDKFSQYRVIVTDRYHGTIFALIANTPVIVISSADHKLKSGVDWFPNSIFGNSIQFANNLDEVKDMVNDILSSVKIIQNPSYLKTNFYSKPLI